MSKTMRMIIAVMFGVVVQTTFVQHIRIAGVAPDILIALLVSITSYCGAYGGYCAGALIALLYDASVGYVLAINIISYTLIGFVAPIMRNFMERLMRRFKYRRYVEMIAIGFLLTAAREVVDIGYMFIIGAEQSTVTLMRLLLCSGYSAMMVLPTSAFLAKLMTWHPTLFHHHIDDLKPKTHIKHEQ